MDIPKCEKSQMYAELLHCHSSLSGDETPPCLLVSAPLSSQKFIYTGKKI